MRFQLLLAVLLGLSWGRPACLRAESEQPTDTAAAPGTDPIPTASASMTQDQLEAYFQAQRKGTPIQLILDKGKNVKGVFSSFDDYYETVWILPRAEERGLLSQKSYKLAGIRGVMAWDRKSGGDDNDGFILMKKDTEAQ